MERIADREALGQVREASKAQVADSRCRILICAGTGCLAGGSGEIYERMCELVKDHPDVEVHFGPEIAHGNGEISVKKSGCHGFCEMGPLMRIEPQGILYTKVQPEDCDEIFHRTIEKGDIIRHLLFKQDGIEYQKQEEIPFYKKQTRNVLKNCGHIDAEHIQEYISTGGYQALEKALFEMTPEEIIQQENDRRDTLFSKILALSSSYYSSNYGQLQFLSGGHFLWSGYQLLSPSVIPSGSGSSGLVSFEYFLGNSLKDSYDGVISFNFESSQKKVSFLYRLEENGIRLEEIPESNIRNNVVQNRKISPLILFFTAQENSSGNSDSGFMYQLGVY